MSPLEQRLHQSALAKVQRPRARNKTIPEELAYEVKQGHALFGKVPHISEDLVNGPGIKHQVT